MTSLLPAIKLLLSCFKHIPSLINPISATILEKQGVFERRENSEFDTHFKSGKKLDCVWVFKVRS